MFQLESNRSIVNAGDGLVVQCVLASGVGEADVLEYMLPFLGHLFHPLLRIRQRRPAEPGLVQVRIAVVLVLLVGYRWRLRILADSLNVFSFVAFVGFGRELHVVLNKTELRFIVLV